MTIRRLQAGYNGGVGALHSHSDDKPKDKILSKVSGPLSGFSARLGPRIMPLDVASGKPIPKPHDYDFWLNIVTVGVCIKSMKRG